MRGGNNGERISGGVGGNPSMISCSNMSFYLMFLISKQMKEYSRKEGRMGATPAGDRRVLPPGGTRRRMVPVQQGHKEPGREGTRERNTLLTCSAPPAKASGGTKVATVAFGGGANGQMAA